MTRSDEPRVFLGPCKANIPIVFLLDHYYGVHNIQSQYKAEEKGLQTPLLGPTMIPTRSPVRESVTDDQSLCGRDHPQTGLDRQAADEQELVRPY